MKNEKLDLVKELFSNEESQKKWGNNLKFIGTVISIPTLTLALILEIEARSGIISRSSTLNAIENTAIIAGALGFLAYFTGWALERPRSG